MIKRGSKRGQFYLISAIVLAAIIIGIVSVSNYLGEDSNSRILDVEEELKIESRSVIEYGMNNSLSDAAFYAVLLDFTEDYTEHVKAGRDVYLLFGTRTNLTISGYQQNADEVILEGSSNTTITDQGGSFVKSLNPGGENVALYVGGSKNDFILTTGRNIYFLISEELNSNEYVIKG